MMSPSWTIRLGSGLALPAEMGNKAAMLSHASAMGLPVPQGYVILHEAWQHALDANLAVRHQGTVEAPDAQRLRSGLALPSLPGPLAVRSAFSSEDGAAQSQAGFYATCLWVDAQDAGQLASALCEVWSSGHAETQRRDILVMQMVDAKVAGVAFTERDYEDDLVNYTSGTAQGLVAGEVEGEALQLLKLSPGSRRVTAALTEPWAIRLQELLRAVRCRFGDCDWDIEWADDGTTCWLVQIRPVTRRTRRNEAFTIANFKEILPELPSRLMTSLIASCADGLFAYYRAFDPTLPAHRPLIEVFYGRPLFNLSLLCDMLRHWGLPTRLVSNSIGGDVDRDTALHLPRLLKSAPALLRLSASQFNAVAQSRRTGRALVERAQQPGDTFAACMDTLQELFTSLVCQMLALTGAMSGPLLLLRRAGVLEEHHARQRTDATEMFIDLAPLRHLAAHRPGIRADLERGRLPADTEFRQVWDAFLAKHGHRGIYESDIARPRFREAPETILASLLHASEGRQARTAPTWRGRLTTPLWWYASRAIRARENLRAQAMRGFEPVRERLLALASEAVARQLLPTLETLWMLDIDEVRQLDQGWRPSSDFLAQREQEIARLSTLPVPDLLHRFDDLQSTLHVNTAPDNGRWTGISLTAGEVEGRAWVLREPATALPDGFSPDQTILVARSVDAGWIPVFGCVRGVVVETGGDLSHGSIILREIGLPAMTNARHVTQQIKTGDWIKLRADVGVVEMR